MRRWQTSLRSFAMCLALSVGACSVATIDDDADWQPPPLAPPPSGALAAATEWARVNAVPFASLQPGSGFEDLRPLKALIGNARIIGFGEGMHDTHEFLMLRNRLFEFFVEEMGVTAIGLETGATEALAADDYVLGRSAASVAAYTSAFSWADEASEENKALLDWVRAYNERPTTKRALRVYGLDLTGGRSGEFTHSRLAPDAMLAYIERVDAKRARQLRSVIDPLLPSFNTRRYDALSLSKRNALSGAIADAAGAFERNQVSWIAATSAFDYWRAYQQAVVSRQIDMGLRNSANVQGQRDASMAHNALSVLQRQESQDRLMVFAYNGHIRKGPTATDPAAFGGYLRELVGDQYFAIGSTFNEGVVGTAGSDEWPMTRSDASTLNVALRDGAGWDLFFVDTRRFPSAGPLADWIERGEPLRQNYFEGRPRSSFDVLIHVDTISPMHALR